MQGSPWKRILMKGMLRGREKSLARMSEDSQRIQGHKAPAVHPGPSESTAASGHSDRRAVMQSDTALF